MSRDSCEVTTVTPQESGSTCNLFKTQTILTLGNRPPPDFLDLLAVDPDSQSIRGTSTSQHKGTGGVHGWRRTQKLICTYTLIYPYHKKNDEGQTWDSRYIRPWYTQNGSIGVPDRITDRVKFVSVGLVIFLIFKKKSNFSKNFLNRLYQNFS